MLEFDHPRNKASMMGNTTSTTAQAHQVTQPSQLMSLAGELENQILGGALTSATPIPLRAERRTTEENKVEHRFNPPLPALAHANKETRAIVPSLYFELNTFYFTDSMLKSPDTVAAFVKARPDSRFVEAIKVRLMPAFQIWQYNSDGSKRYLRQYMYRISFAANTVIDNGEVVLSNLSAAPCRPDAWMSHDAHWNPTPICLCGLQKLAQEVSMESYCEARGAGCLMKFLQRYAELLEQGRAGLDRVETCIVCEGVITHEALE